jgi:hypothetical protein
MNVPELDVLPGLFTYLSGQSALTTRLGGYHGGASIHTRRPVPDNAEYPMMTIGPVIAKADQDGINDHYPVVTLDVIVYGKQPDHYRDVEALAGAVFSLLHRRRNLFNVTDYQVADIRCTGPIPAPTDDDQHVARAVTVTLRLAVSAA